MKKTLTILLTLILCMALIPTMAFASSKKVVTVVNEPGTYNADEAIVVNTNFATTYKDYGCCSWAAVSSSNSEEISEDVIVSDDSFEAYGYEYNPFNGLWIEDADIPEDDMPLLNNEIMADTDSDGRVYAYSVGDMMSIKDNYSGYIDLECLYIGEYCTVWGSLYQANKIRLTASQAKTLADEFDRVYPTVRDAIGEARDPDQDGKLAICCYDIKDDYTTYSGNFGANSYTAGYFWQTQLTGGIDMINVDTFPGMTYSSVTSYSDDQGSALVRVTNVFGTLVHEYQHLINFSYSSNVGLSKMDSFLNEAFSMGTEHMIFGYTKVASRVDNFNYGGSNYYYAGSPLCYWDSSSGNRVLANYSNSYLFGQYLRTQYAQKIGDETGNTFYKDVQLARIANWDSNAFDTIANSILERSKEEIVFDFWTACYLNESSGKYGFNGEQWAMNINPKTTFDTTLEDSGIVTAYNGGAVYGKVPDGKIKIVSMDYNIKVILISSVATYNDGESDCSVTYSAALTDPASYSGLSSDQKKINITRPAEESYTAYAAVYDKDGKLLGIFSVTQNSGGEATLTLGDISNKASKIKVLVADGETGAPAMNALCFGN